uniref:Uncharacterized protein n=1 Tax=Arundo donax TaxID=35708 RepID=A0A0A9D290_ARUDO
MAAGRPLCCSPQGHSQASSPRIPLWVPPPSLSSPRTRLAPAREMAAAAT